ncbi:MAG: DsrE family protein [Pseudomonadales bacterium]|jgi:intracellular sulfur oxidation DsrE/DsrF family protein|nr:DsrE family protein [Pseudomonadales bacterium]
MRDGTGKLLTLLALLGLAPHALSEGAPPRSAGPVFEAWGAVHDEVDPDYMPPVDEYRVLFDVWVGPEDATQPNPRLETLARFMNMHARAGVEAEAMQLALVIHGSAGRAALTDEAYRKRFGTANPDRPLLDALAARGVRMMICGQSAAYRGYGKEEMIAPVDLALSAYSAIYGLQSEGYRLMPTWSP